MKRFFIIALLGQLSYGCADKEPGYNYIKIVELGDADSGNYYNKGMGLGGFFYYNPHTDSVLFRTIQWHEFNDSVFNTYQGRMKNIEYAEAIAKLIEFLKRHKKEELEYVYDGDNYCGPSHLIEYNANGKTRFLEVISLNNDTVTKFDRFFYEFDKTPWDKELVPNNRVNQDEEAVNMLKGLGWYDTIVFTPPYIPLPCEKGIKMELLYGKWRSIGNKYNNANLKYWTNVISKDGSWIMERFSNNELKPRYSGKIISISKDHIIKVKSKDGIANMKVLNLTENCFEYIPVGEDSNQIWRLDRMR